MKIKCIPEDFIVNEISDENITLFPDEFKFYSVFRLEKTGIDFFRVVSLMEKEFHLLRKHLSYCGIKDKHGVTSQLVAVKFESEEKAGKFQKKAEHLDKNGDFPFSFKFLGYRDSPLSSEDMTGNRFSIVLRDIRKSEIPEYIKKAQYYGEFGYLNFFDEQRFGSFKLKNGIPGKHLFLRHYEKTLVTYIEPSRHCRSAEKKVRNTILEHWRDWDYILEQLNAYKGRDPEIDQIRKIVLYIRGYHTSPSFRKAVTMIPKDFLVFVLNAYQSYLFNRIIGQWFVKLCALKRIGFREYATPWGSYYFSHPDRIRNKDLFAPEFGFPEKFLLKAPVPGYDYRVLWDEYTTSVLKNKWESDRKNSGAKDLENYLHDIDAFVARVLAEEKIEPEKMKVKSFLNIDVGAKLRPVFVKPDNLRISNDLDELYPGKGKIILEFDLPRGSYATVFFKALGSENNGRIK